MTEMNIVPQNRNITIRPTSVLCVSHARLRASVLITKVRCILFRSRRRHFIRELRVRCLQIQYGNCALGQSNCLFRFRQQIAGVFVPPKSVTNRPYDSSLHRIHEKAWWRNSAAYIAQRKILTKQIVPHIICVYSCLSPIPLFQKGLSTPMNKPNLL